MRNRAWVIEYLDALPAAMRLNEYDSRYAAAAAEAIRNGWSPADMGEAVAEAVARKARVSFPPGLALRVLTDLAQRAPAAVRRPPAADDPGDWRLMLPLVCSHPRTVAEGRTPNQCWACRQNAGDPIAIARASRAGRCDCGEPGCTRTPARAGLGDAL